MSYIPNYESLVLPIDITQFIEIAPDSVYIKVDSVLEFQLDSVWK